MREKISFTLKWTVLVLSFSGVIWSFFNAEADGYSHWTKRLLYFTSQSNIWVALSMLAILVVSLTSLSKRARLKNFLYILKYVFTVSITLTGFIFCVVLAPGAAKDNYNAWSGASIMTHVLVPVLTIVDFFLDTYRVSLKKRHMFLTAVPPFIYMIFATVLVLMRVDFGRGDAFPYFFFNYYSPAGFFGFSDEMPYILGSFYWIIFMFLLIVGVGALYRRLYSLKKK